MNRSAAIKSDIVFASTAICLFGAPIAMITHIIGTLLGWWPQDGVTWWVALALLVGLQISMAFASDL
jgi:1,4-dihydroxy-2-naphthoate octaprenyltransferase